ncbi:MAG TPA: EAL domain-containing protein [Burkholderiales bacterium]|nr:EAL domain-containing protein [Burkholderiales bacterium]
MPLPAAMFNPNVLYYSTLAFGVFLTGIAARVFEGDPFDIVTRGLTATVLSMIAVRWIRPVRSVGLAKQFADKLQESEDRFRVIVKTVPLPLALVRLPEGSVLFINQRAADFFGVSNEQACGRQAEDYFARPEEWRRLTRTIMRDGEVRDVEAQLNAARGQACALLSAQATVYRGEPTLLIAVHDITARKGAEEALAASVRELRLITENVPALIAHFDGEERCRFCNSQFAELFGRTVAETLGMSLRDVVGQDDYELLKPRIEEALSGSPVTYQQEHHSPWGQIKSIEVVLVAHAIGSAELPGFHILINDITSRKQAEQRISHLAHFDGLTGLPNRNLLQDRVAQAIAHAERNRRELALLFLDLDNFKTINDSLGHDLGDDLLKAVSLRLSVCLRDMDTVGRYGGDEFVIILPDLHDGQRADRVATKILEQLASPFTIKQHELHMGASIGISVFPRDGLDAAALMKSADTAMYHAKESGRNQYQFFTAQMNEIVQARLGIEIALRQALKKEQFTLWYQPQVALASGEIVGVEALVRWNHPTQGLVQPDAFIRVAEESGLIGPIGEWALKEACRQSKAWRDAGLPAINVAVNLSPRQFRRRDLVELVRNALRDTGLEPRYLELELTESALMQHLEETVATLNALRQMGVRIAIDDFGMGYSSLSYLKRFPIGKLKIDRSFVRDIPHDQDDAAIAGAIIAMAHKLALTVVAEGVETPQQLAFLQAHGCDGAQGYFFGRPMPAEEVALLLEQVDNGQLVSAG